VDHGCECVVADMALSESIKKMDRMDRRPRMDAHPSRSMAVDHDGLDASRVDEMLPAPAMLAQPYNVR
jgi:hypothetical protein